MDEPRNGDVVIGADGVQYTVTSHDWGKVRGAVGRKRRTFKLRDLECIDHDDGLWAEVDHG